MWIINYKGYYINGDCDRDECRVIYYPDSCNDWIVHYKSLHAAKLAITRHIKAICELNAKLLKGI